MSSLRRLSVRARFWLVMSLVAVSLLVQAGWGLVSARSGAQTLTALFDQADAAAREVGAMREALAGIRRYQAEMIATAVSNPTGVEPLHAAWKQELAKVDAAGDALVRAHGGDAALAAVVARQKALFADVVRIVDPIAQRLGDAKMDATAALAYAEDANTKLDAAQANLTGVLKSQQAAAVALRADIAAGTMLAAWARVALVGVALAVVLPLMWLTLRSICGPLDQAVAVAARIAGGDLSGDVRIEGEDEPARLMRALAGMQDALRRLVGQVRAASGNLELASAEVAGGNADLSQRTELAASHLQRTTSAMDGLTGTVRGSADAARTANQLASSAADVAARGGQVVDQVVATMTDIHASSRRIADIIGVIDGIAFQTNILALNAAVEAARAGEQGRGFAVVAGEVRSLAQRSAEAAREIKALIGASVERVESGSRLVGDAGATMTEIVASVQRVNDIIGEISAAATEQSRGLDEVRESVGEVDQMTQQNAALVEESAAAAESLKAQAVTLAALVSTFRLAAGTPAVSPASATPAAGAHGPVAAQAIARARGPVRAPAAAPVASLAPPTRAAGASDDWETF